MSFYRPVPPNPYHWNRVIPGVITDAMTYDEMIAHTMWKMDEIINYLVHSVPYLIDVELNANSDSCTLTGFLYDDYQKKEFNHTFTAGGSADGTYYVNYRSAGPDVQPISETTDPIFVSQEYMPMNCTTLYSFTITDEKIDPASVQFNDLYTGMHNADPDAHKALFDAVYAKIDAEIAEVNEALAAETAARQAADTQLQNNIDAEAAAREQADTQLQNNIDAEETAREQADTNLQGQITANDNDISALTTRVGTAESDITALEGQMGTAETNITGLQTRMGAAETKIANNTSAISNEAATRQSEDEALATQISTETQQRKQQDSQLQNNIDAEAAAREQADTQLQNNIDAEETAREQADTNLQGQITANDNDISALTTRVGTAESDITALEGQMGTAETNITGLQTRMGAAETKIANNTSAISNEAATRQSEDEALATQISTETQQRKQQDSQLNTSISANTQAIAALNAGTGTVKTVNTLTGDVTLAAGNNVTITPSGNTLTIAATGGGSTAGVSSVNNVTGAVNLVAGRNVTISPSGQNITIAATGGGSAGVASVNGITGPVTISAGSGAGIEIYEDGSRITIDNTGVTQLNGVAGNATIVGTGGIEVNADTSDITIQTTPGAFAKSVTAATASGGSPVTITPNTSDGAIAMTSGDGSITFGNYNNTNKLDVKTSSRISNAGLWNIGDYSGAALSSLLDFSEIDIVLNNSTVPANIEIHIPSGMAVQYNGTATMLNRGLSKTVNVDGIMTDATASGEYIIMLNIDSVTATAYQAKANSPIPTASNTIPLARLWLATDNTGNPLEIAWEGIAFRSIPKSPLSVFYVTLNMQDDHGDARTVSAPAFKVSDKMLILGNWSYVGATLNPTFATIDLYGLGYTTMPTRSMGGVITTYNEFSESSWGQAGFGGLVSNCTLTVSGTLSSSTWVMAPFYFIWD